MIQKVLSTFKALKTKTTQKHLKMDIIYITLTYQYTLTSSSSTVIYQWGVFKSIWGRNSASVPIRISSKFSQNCLKNFPIQNFVKKNCKVFFYVMLSCILFLQLTELAFIYCYNYLNTLNTLPI